MSGLAQNWSLIQHFLSHGESMVFFFTTHSENSNETCNADCISCIGGHNVSDVAAIITVTQQAVTQCSSTTITEIARGLRCLQSCYAIRNSIDDRVDVALYCCVNQTAFKGSRMWRKIPVSLYLNFLDDLHSCTYHKLLCISETWKTLWRGHIHRQSVNM